MSHHIGAGHALVCLLLLGAMPLLVSARPDDVPALSFTVLVTVWQIASALPLALIEWRKGLARRFIPEALTAGEWSVALLTGGIFGITTWLYVLTAPKVGAVTFIILLQSYPLIASLMEFAILGQRRSFAELVLTGVMIGAIIYLITGGTFDFKGVSPWAFVVISIPVLWSAAHMMLRLLLVKARMTANQVTLSRLSISLAFLLAATAASGETGQLLQSAGRVAVQGPALLFGAVYYLELLFWFLAMRHISVSLASSITVPAPALTMAASFFLLGEVVSPHQFIAMIVVAASLYGLLYLSGRPKT